MVLRWFCQLSLMTINDLARYTGRASRICLASTITNTSKSKAQDKTNVQNNQLTFSLFCNGGSLRRWTSGSVAWGDETAESSRCCWTGLRYQTGKKETEQRLKNWKLGDKILRKSSWTLNSAWYSSFADEYRWDCPTQCHYKFVSRLQNVKEGNME